jgi:hypothetical protein
LQILVWDFLPGKFSSASRLPTSIITTIFSGETRAVKTCKEGGLVHLLSWKRLRQMAPGALFDRFRMPPNSVILFLIRQMALPYYLAMAQRSDDCLSHAEVRSR